MLAWTPLGISGPPWPSQFGTAGPEISARSTFSDGQWPGATTRAMAPQLALGQRKELLFLPSRWEFCCINQLSVEPNTIKPKQSLKLGGKTSLMYIHWVMLHLWEGTPARPRGKKSMAHQSARASSTGGQEGQLHLVAALQPD